MPTDFATNSAQIEIVRTTDELDRLKIIEKYKEIQENGRIDDEGNLIHQIIEKS